MTKQRAATLIKYRILERGEIIVPDESAIEYTETNKEQRKIIITYNY
jgi:hypothetical protein